MTHPRPLLPLLAFWTLFAGSALAPTEASAGEFRSAADVLANFKAEPTVLDLQNMVLEYSKTDSHYVDAWLAASTASALLPEVTFGYGYDNGYGQDFDYIDLDGDGIATVADESVNASGVDVKHAFDAKAKWSLSKLVMSSERIRVISETQDIVKLRDKVLDEATRLYFDRRRLQVDMLMNEGDVKTQIKNELRLQELTAQLDAYTGGQFSRALKKP